MKIKPVFTIDHDAGYDNKAFLVGDFNNQRFVETFNSKSWLNISLRFKKYLIIKRFKIIYGD
jgi:hypothetical protein